MSRQRVLHLTADGTYTVRMAGRIIKTGLSLIEASGVMDGLREGQDDG